MRTEKGYRFNLQFSNDTLEGRVVGEFLESRGNNKSDTLLPIIYEYLAAHPELTEENTKVTLVLQQAVSKDDFLEIYNRLVAEGKITVQAQVSTPQPAPDKPAPSGNSSAQKMLSNLAKLKK